MLATPEFDHSISKVFQSVGRRYVQYFNFPAQRHVMGRALSSGGGVDSEPYLLTLMRYIELNPVRAGMVAQPGDYPWSSFRHHALGESGVNADWLETHEEYLRLGRNEQDRQSAYRELFSMAFSDNALAEIRECTHKGWPLGGERFREQIGGAGAAARRFERCG